MDNITNIRICHREHLYWRGTIAEKYVCFGCFSFFYSGLLSSQSKFCRPKMLQNWSKMSICDGFKQGADSSKHFLRVESSRAARHTHIVSKSVVFLNSPQANWIRLEFAWANSIRLEANSKTHPENIARLSFRSCRMKFAGRYISSMAISLRFWNKLQTLQRLT